MASLAPSAAMTGFSVNRTRLYRPQVWMGWVVLMVGVGLLIRLEAGTETGVAVGYLVICGIGLGFLFSSTLFPVLAPLPISQSAPALAFLLFIRSFAGVWGVTIGSTVLQNELKRHLPPSFTSQFPKGVTVAYALIPQVPTLPQPLKGEVQAAFAESLKTLWEVILGITAAGMLVSLLMKGLPLHGEVDKEWTLKREESGRKDPESGEEAGREEEKEKKEADQEAGPREGE